MGLRRAARLPGRQYGKRRRMTSAPGHARGSTSHRAAMSAARAASADGTGASGSASLPDAAPTMLSARPPVVRSSAAASVRRRAFLSRSPGEGIAVPLANARTPSCVPAVLDLRYAKVGQAMVGGIRVSCIGGPGDRFGGDEMTMTDRTRDVLRATGNVLAWALGVTVGRDEVRSSGGLTSAVEGSDSIMVAGSPGRRVAGSPGRRVAGSPGRRR